MHTQAFALGALALGAMAAPQDYNVDENVALGTPIPQVSESANPSTTKSGTGSSASPGPLGHLLDYNGILKQLASNESDHVHVADDGVIRSYAANGTVLNAIRLTNAQIKSMIADLPAWMDPYIPHLNDVYADVDGTKIPADSKTLLDPPYEFLSAYAGGPNNTDSGLEAVTEGLYRKLGKSKTAEETVAEYQVGQNDEASLNANWTVKQKLKQDIPFCLGQKCSTDQACRTLGCLVCAHYDLLMNLQRVCQGIGGDDECIICLDDWENFSCGQECW